MTTTRNATLQDLHELLMRDQARKLDLVVPAAAIHSVNGSLVVKGAGTAEITESGVTTGDSTFVPTKVADEHLAEKLGIPLTYLRRLRDSRPDLLDANVNGWLHGTPYRVPTGPDGMVHPEPGSGPDPRKFLLRAFRPEDGEPGIARALLSDSFKVVDNLDVLMAGLDGIRQAGVAVNVEGCDLSERRMYVRVVCPEVKALAPSLLAGYRSPFGQGGIERTREVARREGQGYDPGTEPVVFAGFVLSNSEVGGGAFTLAPRLWVQICKNGLVIKADALRSIHLGSRHAEGEIVRWSGDTLTKELELVTAQARDAVATFLNADYVNAKVAEMTEKANRPVGDPAQAVEVVTNRLRIPEARAKDVLAHFIAGGQLTVGGIAQAVSSVAQTIDDADDADDFESMAVKVLDMAAV